MLKKFISITAASLITLVAVAQNKADKNKTFMSVFDTQKQEYLEIQGGIEENILNQFGTEYKTPEAIETMQFYDFVERNHVFQRKTKNEAKESEEKMLMTTRTNMFLLEELDKYKQEEIPRKYQKTKEMMKKIDLVYLKEKNELKKFQETYKIIRQYIHSNGNVDGTLSLEELTNGKGGDCSEMTSAYYSILKFYGFNIYMRISRAKAKEDEQAYGHAWLHVKLDAGSFDLDPRFYKDMLTPIEDRDKNINYISIEPKYVMNKQ